MDQLLKQLLNRLDEVGSSNAELYDSECRDRMSDAIHQGFLSPKPGFAIPTDLGLYDDSANVRVAEILADYIREANALALETGLTTFRQRLEAFQNDDVESDQNSNYYDDFFGSADPEDFDEDGVVKT